MTSDNTKEAKEPIYRSDLLYRSGTTPQQAKVEQPSVEGLMGLVRTFGERAYDCGIEFVASGNTDDATDAEHEAFLAIRSYASRLAGQGEQPAPAAAVTEAVAQAIYEQWQHLDGWVPWVPGGNSHKQYDARHIAIAALASAPAPAGDAPKGWKPDEWATYIAGVIDTYLSGPNAERERDRREEAIAGIIRRRINWLMPAASPTVPGDAPRPVTAQEDAWLRNAATRSATLVAPGSLAGDAPKGADQP